MIFPAHYFDCSECKFSSNLTYKVSALDELQRGKKGIDLILFPVFLRLDLHVQAVAKSCSWQHKAIFLNTRIKTEQLVCMAKHFTAD